MRPKQIVLTSYTLYDKQNPPAKAVDGQVSRIRSRTPGTRIYEKEYLGQVATITAESAGLYERRNGELAGGCSYVYNVVVDDPYYGLLLAEVSDIDCSRIAGFLGNEIPIGEAVIVKKVHAPPASPIEPRTCEVAVSTPSRRAKAAFRRNVTAATAKAWAGMCELSPTEQQAVLTELRRFIRRRLEKER